MAMALAVGTHFNHYEVISPLGAGGMGEVWLAQDTRLKRRVALKLLPAQFTQDADRLRRFEQEAQAASALNHPNIITIYEIGAAPAEQGGTHFIATEYIDGATLREHLQRARLPLAAALDYAIQIAAALAAAHEAGIIHRDLKPENVMVRRDGIVKVLDFGLAKLTEKSGEAAPGQAEVDKEAATLAKVATDPGVVLGTPQYMSPEQARGQKADARADLFSLGVVLYEMLAGRPPFAGVNAIDVMAAILDREPPPLDQQVPAELQRIVSKALRKDREQRYQTSKDLLLDLRDCREELAFAAKLERAGQAEKKEAVTEPAAAVPTNETAAVNTTSSASIILSEIKRHKRGVTAALAVLVLLLGGIGYGLYRALDHYSSTSPPPPELQFTPLTSHGKAVTGAISPDGKLVAYAKDEGGKQSLWLRQTAVVGEQQIAPPAETVYRTLTFARDGNFLYYTVREPESPLVTLYQMTLLGNRTKKLIAGVDSPITFSPDQKQLAFVRANRTQGEYKLIIANADGSNEKILAVKKRPDFFLSNGGDNPGGLAWSPDGKFIACSVGNNAGVKYETVVAVEVATGAERPLDTQKWNTIDRFAWMPDGNSLMMAAVRKGNDNRGVWQLLYPNGEIRRVINDLNNYVSLSVTDDGRLLVTTREIYTSIYTLFPDNTGQMKQVVSKSGKSDGWWGLTWLPGDKIVYIEPVMEDSNIWMMDADGGNRKLIHTGRWFDGIDASADGRYLVFMSAPLEEAWNAVRMDLTSGNIKQLTSRDPIYNPSISPDGKWVFYRRRSGSRLVIWRVPIEGGQPEQLTDRASESAVVSPDGKLIAYRDFEQEPAKLGIMPFAGGQPSKLFDFVEGVILPNGKRVGFHWTPDGKAVTYVVTRNGVSNLWNQPLNGGPAKQITHFDSEWILCFDWSREGKLVLARGGVNSDVVLLSGFK